MNIGYYYLLLYIELNNPLSYISINYYIKTGLKKNHNYVRNNYNSIKIKCRKKS